MSTYRQLSPNKVREVTLAHLCGIDKTKIKKRFSIANDFHFDYILSHPTFDPQDSLVNFYKSNGSDFYDNNAVHLYLAFNNRAALNNGDIVSLDREKELYTFLKKEIYNPGIKQTIDWSNLDDFITPNFSYAQLSHFSEKSLDSVNTYEVFLWRLLGERNKDHIVESFLVRKLSREYNSAKAFSLPNVFPEAANSIQELVRADGLKITPSKEIIIQNVLLTLPEQERHVLTKRYGLDGSNKLMIQQEIGQPLDLTRSRVSQIELKAFFNLKRRKPHLRLDNLLYVYGIISEEEAKLYLTK